MPRPDDDSKLVMDGALDVKLDPFLSLIAKELSKWDEIQSTKIKTHEGEEGGNDSSNSTSEYKIHKV